MLTRHDLAVACLVAIIFAAVLTVPRWPYASGWGPAPSVILWVVALALLIMVLTRWI